VHLHPPRPDSRSTVLAPRPGDVPQRRSSTWARRCRNA
jgi:hypothetical protein